MRFPITRTSLVRLVFQFPLLFFDQPLQLIEQFAVMLAHCFDNARQHGPNALSSMAQQTVDHVFADAVRKFFARNSGSIKKGAAIFAAIRSEEHTSELQSLAYLVCRLLLEKKKE